MKLTANRMPRTQQYDLVSDDGYDSRIPLHNEEAFQHGLEFQAKYIGTLDVPRPSSRVEIVAAMRRIRYEFKAKAIKKMKVNIVVSVEGLKILMRKKAKRRQQWAWDENRQLLMHHQIYRIFYVSHDSQDLKIFSYIARDGSTNVFKCNVFKANKKSHAMRIVRTVGQAFEVCHKLSLAAAQKEDPNDGGSEKSSEDDGKSTPTPEKCVVDSSSGPLTSVSSTQSPEEALRQAQQLLNSVGARAEQAIGTISSPSSLPLEDSFTPTNDNYPVSNYHQYQLLRQQMDQQQQQTQVAIAQAHLLKDQLSAETAARIEAQARTHQLLIHNRELLEHINTLVRRLQDVEHSLAGSRVNMNFSPPQIPVLSDPTTPEPGPVFLPDFRDVTQGILNQIPEEAMHIKENAPAKGTTKDPDSGNSEVHNTLAPLSGHSNSRSVGNLSSRMRTGINRIPDTTSGFDVTKAGLCDKDMNGKIELATDTAQASDSCNMTGATQTNFDLPLRNTTAITNRFSPEGATLASGSGTDNNANTASRRSKPLEAEQKADPKTITPVPSQEARSNRLDMKLPKLDPPPKVVRNTPRNKTTPVFSNADSLLSPDSNGNPSSNASGDASGTTLGSVNGSVTGSVSGSVSGSSCQSDSSLSLSDKRNSEDSGKTYHDNCINEDEELTTLPNADKALYSLNTKNINLSTGRVSDPTKTSRIQHCNVKMVPTYQGTALISHSHNTNIISNPLHSKTNHGGRRSISDEENGVSNGESNGESSEDSGLPHQSGRLDTMTFTEFEALDN